MRWFDCTKTHLNTIKTKCDRKSDGKKITGSRHFSSTVLENPPKGVPGVSSQDATSRLGEVICSSDLPLTREHRRWCGETRSITVDPEDMYSHLTRALMVTRWTTFAFHPRPSPMINETRGPVWPCTHHIHMQLYYRHVIFNRFCNYFFQYYVEEVNVILTILFIIVFYTAVSRLNIRIPRP